MPFLNLEVIATVMALVTSSITHFLRFSRILELLGLRPVSLDRLEQNRQKYVFLINVLLTNFNNDL